MMKCGLEQIDNGDAHCKGRNVFRGMRRLIYTLLALYRSSERATEVGDDLIDTSVVKQRIYVLSILQCSRL